MNDKARNVACRTDPLLVFNKTTVGLLGGLLWTSRDTLMGLLAA